ncbi:C2H2 type zinc-finger-domain-containing protein [Gloeopeniophorella convolvens]|nr:C2H2 type zinc-finger-domain-containing protein [Gloeopeniophorella convolvens]
MADTQTTVPGDQHLFTCLSCTIAFLTAEDQRDHYRSDHHRYNMKRRVASLPPVSAAVFNQKVLERRQETAVMLSPKGSTCEVCNKAYTTENAYRSHMNSKKHRENELKALSRVTDPRPAEADAAEATQGADTPEPAAAAPEPAPPTQATAKAPDARDAEEEDDEDEDEELTLEQKLAAARSRLSPAHCLFCSNVSSSLEDNLTHMSGEHSFFIPDAEYLVDPTGLVIYLGEKIAVGNICIFCNGKGREFRTLDAVRKHMVDKSHCKIAYDNQNDMLEVSDYYDFSASYPDAEEQRKRKEERKAQKAAKKATAQAAEGWEDVDEDEEGGEVDEVVEEPASSDTPDGEDDDDDADDSSDTDSLPENQITFGDSHLELVLPSGNRIGHRSMRRYYAQSFPGAPRSGKPEDPNSGRAIVRRLLADKNAALVPRGGGFGAFGAGTEVVKARNRGEAREAGRHIREFRDQKRREDYKTRVAFVHNHQKHYRDPLLQVLSSPFALLYLRTNSPLSFSQ